MYRAKRNKSHGMSSDATLSGHIGDWEALAVGFVDGLLDQASEGAMRQHLGTCPDCARRLASQQGTLTFLRHTALAEAPKELEAKVLSEVLAARNAAHATQVARTFPQRRSDRRPRTWLNTTRPWMPATVAALVLLAAVVAFGVTSQRNLSEESAATIDVALNADAELAAADTEAGTGTARNPGTTTPGLAAAGASATESTEDAAVLMTAGLSASSSSMQPSGPYLESRAEMASALTRASAPGYFFFDVEGGGLVTAQQAESVASQVTALTGLQLMDKELSSGVRAFAAFVTREDATAVVDLLCSIGGSLQLAVGLSLQPGSALTAWAESLLEQKYSLAELCASPTQPPATAGWSYTTSTSPPAAAGEAQAPKTPPLADAATHVLVVILVNVEM